MYTNQKTLFPCCKMNNLWLKYLDRSWRLRKRILMLLQTDILDTPVRTSYQHQDGLFYAVTAWDKTLKGTPRHCYKTRLWRLKVTLWPSTSWLDAPFMSTKYCLRHDAGQFLHKEIQSLAGPLLTTPQEDSALPVYCLNTKWVFFILFFPACKCIFLEILLVRRRGLER